MTLSFLLLVLFVLLVLALLLLLLPLLLLSSFLFFFFFFCLEGGCKCLQGRGEEVFRLFVFFNGFVGRGFCCFQSGCQHPYIPPTTCLRLSRVHLYVALMHEAQRTQVCRLNLWTKKHHFHKLTSLMCLIGM